MNPVLITDCYKQSHRFQYPKGTTSVYSTLTPRSNKHFGIERNVVVFGIRYAILNYVLKQFQNNFFALDEDIVVKEYENSCSRIFGTQEFDSEHIRALHKLGYLPVKICALPDGITVPFGTPVLDIENTHPDFYWLTNYLETLISVSTWQIMTSANIARRFRRACQYWANVTMPEDQHGYIDFQCHDFSMRGMHSYGASVLSGLGHLLYFKGSDTIPAIEQMRAFFHTKETSPGYSVPATEHSVMSCHGLDEFETFRYLIEDLYPSGVISIVSDTYDFWKNVTEVLPALKDKIMSRDGKVVIRPDSGDIVNIICGDPAGKTEHERKGLIECLWDIFGGTVNGKGYKELDPHIGAIYGDGVTPHIVDTVLEALAEKGFAANNIVFGVGSYTYGYVTRDTLGFAIKSTHAVINGEERQIFKDPATDKDKIKKSHVGYVKVVKDGDSYKAIDGLTSKDDFSDSLLEKIYSPEMWIESNSFEFPTMDLDKAREAAIAGLNILN